MMDAACIARFTGHEFSLRTLHGGRFPGRIFARALRAGANRKSKEYRKNHRQCVHDRMPLFIGLLNIPEYISACFSALTRGRAGGLIQAQPVQQRLDRGFSAAKIPEKLHGILAATL